MKTIQIYDDSETSPNGFKCFLYSCNGRTLMAFEDEINFGNIVPLLDGQGIERPVPASAKLALTVKVL